MTLKEFNLEELNQNNGKDGKPAYIAYKGKVYDVTNSKMWKEGKHMNQHFAGEDLTNRISAAPHGEDVLNSLPPVGTFKSAGDYEEHIPDFLQAIHRKVPMLRRHPHPMSVHFPTALGMIVPLFIILYIITGYKAFEETSFHIIGLNILVTPAAILTGFYTWWINYMKRWNLPMKVKVPTAFILWILLIVAFIWRMKDPNIVNLHSTSGVFYIILTFIFPIGTGILGWFGAKMTFPD
jgi:predicted heme/steroid binding protein/uncharacterized membrane protein